MEILTAALKDIHRKYGMKIVQIDERDVALTTETGDIVKIFHPGEDVLDVWDTADNFLLQQALN